MKTYLYIKGFKIEQADTIECQPKAGGIERTHRKQRGINNRANVEASVMLLAKKVRSQDRNKERKAKREARRK